MLRLIFVILSLIAISLSISADDLPEHTDFLPEYTMMDLGTLDTDASDAIAINENEQVLGWFEDKGKQFWFIWKLDSGLKIIDFPNSRWWPYHLNNKGQVLINDGEGDLYLYDSCVGFIEIGSIGNRSDIRGFNDEGQIIGTCYLENKNYSFFLSNSKLVDLTNEFKKTFGDVWTDVYAINLTNDGSVLIRAHKRIKKKDGDIEYIEKLFIWNNGVFSNISDDYKYNNLGIEKIGDDGSLFGYCRERDSYIKSCFINSAGNVFRMLDNCDKILNDYPIRIGYLLGKIKKDTFGNLYYGRGLIITKLFKEEFPFYNVSKARINDQNSKDVVVGKVSTMYPANHAFIAFPKR